MENLQACLDCTDWDAFKTATNSLDKYTEAVKSYIRFCEDCCIPSRTRVSYHNDKTLVHSQTQTAYVSKGECVQEWG